MVDKIKKIPIWLLVRFQSLLTIISPELNTRWLHWRLIGKIINLQDPRTYSEKINWLKLFVYRNHPLVIRCSDKYAIRSYIHEVGFPEILNDLYGVYDSPKDIPWDKLPDAFVIKWNFGNGYNLFCFEKSSFDKKAAIRKLNKWRKRKPHLYRSVMHYKYIPRKIIIEKLIKGDSGKLPDDYKIYCFNGKPVYVMLCKNRESGKARYYYYTTDWQFVKLIYQNPDPVNDPPHERPKGIEEAIKYACMLAKPFPFVRIDFYLVDGNPILGEMTFVPSGGFEIGINEKRQMLFGDLLNLSGKEPVIRNGYF